MTKHFKAGIMRSLVAFWLVTVALLSAHAQVPVALAPVPRLQFFDASGNPLSFGCVFTYQVNTVTPLATYTDNTGVTQNANPVVLTAGGSASIWIQTGVAYTFKIVSAGGTNCALGTTLYTVNGIGGGSSTLTTIVPYSPTPTFTISAQNQLFKITLTGNASSQPLTAVGIVPPAFAIWEITQDGAGAHTFSWPANSVGGCTIGPNGNQVTLQEFVWDGAQAVAVGPCVTGNGPTISTGNIFDYGLTPLATLCTDANRQLTSSCAAVLGITVNGQAISPGGSGNVNNGSATHSMALNEGNGNAITGLALGANQVPLGAAGADPTAATVPTTSTNQAVGYNGSSFTTVPVGVVNQRSITTMGGNVALSGLTTILTKSVTMPSSGCPCSVLVSYAVNVAATPTHGNGVAKVNDGSVDMATKQFEIYNDSTPDAVAASSFSPTTYANNANVTFTLQMQGNTGSFTAQQANQIPIGQNSWMNVVVFANSN